VAVLTYNVRTAYPAYNNMSTFKVQPVYAELILGWLDAAADHDALFTAEDVLTSIHWPFKGGSMGDYPMRFRSDYTDVTFPAGSSSAISASGPFSRARVALDQLIARRRTDSKRRARARADWVASYSAVKSMLSDRTPSRPALTGMSAVYAVASAIWEYCDSRSTTPDWENVQAYTRESVVASAAASHLHVATCADLCSATFTALASTRIDSLSLALRQYDSAMRHSGSQTARERARRVGRLVMDGSIPLVTRDLYEVLGPRFRVAGMTVAVGHGIFVLDLAGRIIALSKSDIQRVHQMLTAICSGLFATVSQACVAPGRERSQAARIGAAYEAQVSRIMSAARVTPAGDEVYVCKTFKRAFGAYLGELAGPLCRIETDELWAETRSTTHASKYDTHGWVAEIRGWSASTAFNLGKVYKVCPAPDASPGLTLLERHEMVTNRNVMQPHMTDRFKAMHRAQILRAYIRRPGVKLALRSQARVPTWWSAYRSGVLDSVPTSEIHQYLEWERTATMPARSAHDPSVWKDSGLGWDSFEEAVDPDRPQRHGNMLTRMVFDSSVPMPGVRHATSVHDHKIDIKPEGHKDPARGIYSGNIRDRLNQSWMEVAVQDVARFHPSFMIGVDAATRDERVKIIVSRNHDPRMIDVYYSFDIAGWSPRMSDTVQELSHQNWAELYDEDLFRRASQINNNARIYMNKHGYTGWYTNPGANLEGYNGKEMTYILITLMCLAVEAWRIMVVDKGLATAAESMMWSAILLAYIDDGLAKLSLPRARATRLFKLFQTCTVDTFAECGFTVELSKCYPSDRFAIFLNEPYLGGRHVVHGTRAAMTICAENTEPHTTLVERVSSVSTGCRGAVMAGLDAITGTMLQAYHTYKHIREWVRRPDPVVAALWSFAPRAWGGLGLPTALQLGTSGGGSALEESVNTMQCWAKCSIPARKLFLTCVRMEMSARTSTGVLLAPLGGRVSSATMIETRVPDAVRDALTRIRSTGGLSLLAREFLAYSSAESLDTYSGCIVPLKPGVVLQEQLLSDLSSAHPHAIFSSFARRIEKSTTLIALVGQRTVIRIMKANRQDAARSYATFKRQIS